ncbi:MAG: alpha/beta hydrolase family protein [Burkholderiales bacterium]
MPHLLSDGPADARDHVRLAHGAGAPMTSPFMTAMADLLAARGLRVSRFELAYMAARRGGGALRPPPKAELLMGEYDAVARALAVRRGQRLLIGGKSLGGRVASLVAGQLFSGGAIAGLVCLGYPFHPPGRPESLRTAHLAGLRCPALIVQGERDPFGTRAEVEGYRLSPAIRLHWAADGDHDLAPRRTSATDHARNLAAAAGAIAEFASGV